MVAKVLVAQDIDGGRSLVEELDRERVPVSAAFWLFEPEAERYRLFVATSDYDRRGPLEAYRLIQSALEKLPENLRPSLIDINVVSPSDATTQALGKAIHTGNSTSPIRFSRNTVGDLYVEDALIYRLN